MHELQIALYSINILISIINSMLNKESRGAWLCSAMGWAIALINVL